MVSCPSYHKGNALSIRLQLISPHPPALRTAPDAAIRPVDSRAAPDATAPRRSGKKRETAAGGFGGILRGTGYDLKNITFTIGNGSRTLKKVTVTADFGPASEQPYFGSLGMDLFEKFDRIVFDFGRMFVTAE